MAGHVTKKSNWFKQSEVGKNACVDRCKQKQTVGVNSDTVLRFIA